MKIINVDIIKSPINWFIVLLMLLIAAFAGHFVLKAAGVSPAPRNNQQ